jgi:hypothetical protein
MGAFPNLTQTVSIILCAILATNKEFPDPEQMRLPFDNLVIKNGMPLIILRNFEVEKGLCNGTRVYVLELWR